MAVLGEKVYVPAIMRASGVTREQAKTCLYYAVATYLIPDKLDRMPILAIIGAIGTGKTKLLKQLRKMVNEPKLIAVESAPTLRDKLKNTVTALIDEGDNVNEDYLIRRYDKATSTISYKKSPGAAVWITKSVDIFGATIIARRIPFKDQAATSRSIVIRTKYKEGDYRVKKVPEASEDLNGVAQKVSIKRMTSQRIEDNWMPLRAVAKCLGDTEWLEYSNEEIKRSTLGLKRSQKYEPEEALLLVLKENMIKLVAGEEMVISDDVLMSAIKKDLISEFDQHLKNVQIQEMCQQLGFKIVTHSGYPKVKCNQKLLDKLLRERQ